MTRRLRAVTVVALATACLTQVVAPAHADDVYTVHTCQGPDGEPATAEGWTFHGVGVERHSDCLAGGEITGGPTEIQYELSQPFGWIFQAPADTRIVAWTLFRTVVIPRGDPWAWNWNLFRDEVIFDDYHRVERCYPIASSCRGFGDGTISDASMVGESDVDLGAVIGNVDCNPAPCPPNSGGTMRIHRGDFTLRDTSDPVFLGTPSGDLMDTQRPLAGVRGVSFSATDQGGGLFQATVEIDGQPVVTEPVDGNGGRCVKPFTAALPCRSTASGTIAFDTSTLPDGQHSVRLIVTDATETNTAAFGPVQVTTMNRSPECDPAVPSASSPVAAAFRGSRRLRITRRSGRATVVGRIAEAGAGTLVHLLSRELRTSAPSLLSGTAVTEPDGSFALPVARGPSRRLRAAYRVHETNPFLACSRALNLRVPARARLTASPRRVRPGRRVRLSGRLLGGGVPRRGKLVDLQARSRGAWRTFATGRTDARGRFRNSYRFNRRAVSATYPIRVRVPAEASYPFDLGYSRAVRVRVR